MKLAMPMLTAVVCLIAIAGPAGGQTPYLVKDINPAAVGPGGGLPHRMVAVGTRVFFTSLDPDHGSELWQSDGTEAGTYLVKDIAPGTSSSSPSELVALN
ncbi:MAG TPA: ELWxxDGT repeat protein, partial [Vicinamibacteria bacterium]